MRLSRLAAATLLVLLLALLAPAGAAAAPAWADAGSATVHPGVQTFTEGAQCTANLLFTSGETVYIGQAAHCSATGAAPDPDGCLATSLPLGTPVEATGASRPGTLAYSSWLTMQRVGETDASTCAHNDFALVELHPDDVAAANPSLPVLGGPVGLNTDGVAAGEVVHSYGNSSLRQGITLLSPKTGVSLGTTGEGWSHPLYSLTPGIPGDSGSAFLDADGNALGVLSTLTVLPTPLSNNVSDLARALDYLRAHEPALGGVQLALGTEPFTPSLIGLLPLP